jgi:hypothetical protein
MIATNQEAVYRIPLERHHETDQRMQRKLPTLASGVVLLMRYEWRQDHPSSFLCQFVLPCCCILSPLFVSFVQSDTLWKSLDVSLRCHESRVSNSFERWQVQFKLKRNGIQGHLFGDSVHSLVLIKMDLVIATRIMASRVLDSSLADICDRQSQIVKGIRRGADKFLTFPILPTGGLQHNQKNFPWMS